MQNDHKPRKKRNYIFWLAALLALVMGGGMVASSLMDWQQYKPMIEAKATEALGRKVSINGSLDGMLFPLTRITVKDVVIANVKGGKAENFLTLASATVELSPLSLLAGRVDVSEITFEQPIVNLEQYQSGNNNWQFGAKTTTATAVGESAAAGASAPAWLNLQKLRLENGRIDFWQEVGNQRQVLDKLVLKAGVDLAAKRADWDLTGLYQAQELRSTGKLAPGQNGIDVTADIGHGIGNMSFVGVVADVIANPKNHLTANGKWTASLFGDALNGSGVIALQNKELNLDDVALAMGATKFTGNATIKLLEPMVVDAKFQADTIDVAAVQKTLAALATEANKIMPAASSGQKTEKSAAGGLPVRGNANLRVTKVILPNGMSAERLAVIASTMDGKTINIQRLGADLPGDTSLDLSGAYQLAGAGFDGRMQITWGNLPKFVAALGMPENAWLMAQPARAELKTGLRTDASAIRLSGYQFDHGDLRSNGDASWSMADKAFSHKGKTTHPNLQKLLAKPLPVNGALAIDSDVSGRIGDAGLDYASLQGTLSTRLNDGIVDGIDLKRISLRLRELNGLQDFTDLVQQTKQTGTTKFDSASADWTIVRGVMDTKNIAVKSDVVAVAGVGQVPLAAQTMDIKARVNFIDHAQVPAVGVRAFGPWAAPQQEYDTAALQGFLAQRALGKTIDKTIGKEKLQEKIDKQADKLLNKLFGQ